MRRWRDVRWEEVRRRCIGDRRVITPTTFLFLRNFHGLDGKRRKSGKATEDLQRMIQDTQIHAINL
jgi:hypothetical protein